MYRIFDSSFILDMDEATQPQECIYIDEAGNDLSKKNDNGNILELAKGQLCMSWGSTGVYHIVYCRKSSRASAPSCNAKSL